MDRRIHERHPARFQVRVTDLASPDVSGSGQSFDISESGIGVYLPLRFTPGSAVELNINDSTLFGVVTHCDARPRVYTHIGERRDMTQNHSA